VFTGQLQHILVSKLLVMNIFLKGLLLVFKYGIQENAYCNAATQIRKMEVTTSTMLTKSY
jgi:hypothetical protein